MAFPWLALLATGASELGRISDRDKAIREQGQAIQDRIRRTRAQQLGAQPYGMMAADFEMGLDDMRRKSDEQGSNNLGLLLQSYLKSEMNGPPEGGIGQRGDDSEEGFARRRAARAGGELIGHPALNGQSVGVGGGGGVGVPGPAQTVDPWESLGTMEQVDTLFGNSEGDPWDEDPWGDAGY
jgi:hypothetical protein